MDTMKTIRSNFYSSVLCILFLGLVGGCATGKSNNETSNDYVEIANPALTMSPGAPATIWVPRKSVESGVPRGSELLKQGYKAVTNETVTLQQAGITAPGGKAGSVIPRFGLVVAVDGEKIYFNIGREAGLTPFQKLKVYRGGTIVEGLGLAPGEFVTTIEVQGFVGTNGGYGLVRQGVQLRINDLVGIE